MEFEANYGVLLTTNNMEQCTQTLRLSNKLTFIRTLQSTLRGPKITLTSSSDNKVPSCVNSCPQHEILTSEKPKQFFHRTTSRPEISLENQGREVL